MRNFIGNEYNKQAVVSNIVNGTLGNIVILYGEYGTGKTEFAKEIAKTLVCLEPTYEGYCNKCKECTKDRIITENTFLSNIALYNMVSINADETRSLIKEATTRVSSGNVVYIFDEFQGLQPKSNQELWLAETIKLKNAYLILTTTKLDAIDKGLQSRAVKIHMNTISLEDTIDLLKSYNLSTLDYQVMKQLYYNSKGQPRDILVTAKYISNARLSVQEQLELISNNKSINILDLLQLLSDKVLYISTAKEYIDKYKEYDLSISLKNLLWEHIIMDVKDYKKTVISNLLSKETLIQCLLLLEDKSINYVLLYLSTQCLTTYREKQEIKPIAKDSKISLTRL